MRGINPRALSASQVTDWFGPRSRVDIPSRPGVYPPALIGAAAAAGSGSAVVSVPAHQAGDLLIVCSFKTNGSTAAPPAPTGVTLTAAVTGYTGSVAWWLGYAVLADSASKTVTQGFLGAIAYCHAFVVRNAETVVGGTGQNTDVPSSYPTGEFLPLLFQASAASTYSSSSVMEWDDSTWEAASDCAYSGWGSSAAIYKAARSFSSVDFTPTAAVFGSQFPSIAFAVA